MKTAKLLLFITAAAALSVFHGGCAGDDSGEPDKYRIVVSHGENGTVAVTVGGAEAAEAAAGVVVTITATPAEGYDFSRWTVTKGGVTLETPESPTATFTMPAEEVNITAEFTESFPDDVFGMITDAAFKEYCERFDADRDGKLTKSEALAVTTINIYSAGVSNVASLAGIEYFPNLEYLDCGGNPLTTLDVSKNTQLMTLYCYFNQLSTLDVSKNTQLTTLKCQDNQLTTLDVSKNTQLVELACGTNQLSTLDVSKNTQLMTLYCYSNQLSTLDVSKNTQLVELDCGANQLSTLDVSGCTKLETLNCHTNQLSTLDVSKNTQLTMLDCQSNQLSTLDVSKNTQLVELYCYNNKLTTLDVSGCTKLETLNCQTNQLTSLDVSKNTKLTMFSCRDNKLTSLDISKNTLLKSLYCQGNADLAKVIVWSGFDIANPLNSIATIYKDSHTVFERTSNP